MNASPNLHNIYNIQVIVDNGKNINNTTLLNTLAASACFKCNTGHLCSIFMANKFTAAVTSATLENISVRVIVHRLPQGHAVHLINLQGVHLHVDILFQLYLGLQ